MKFVTVFDLLESGFKTWTFIPFELIFVVVGLGVFFAPKIFKKYGISYLGFKTKSYKFFSYFFLGFSLLMFSLSFYSTYSEYLFFKKQFKTNSCKVVEGQVENFDPMPYAGHKNESFCVKGIKFEYSDFVVTNAFNNTKSHGGPVGPDSYVRISYVRKGRKNYILRLEIRGYSGPIKDYSKARSPFPSIEDIKKSGFKSKREKFMKAMPWYSNLFLYIYLIDVIGVIMLFPPYLNTFITIGKKNIEYSDIPSTLKNGAKLKLKHTLLALDNDNKVIWMRARAMNFIHCPLAVTKWILDPSQPKIIRQEIKFSSGLIVATIAMLFTVKVMIKEFFKGKNFDETSAMMFFGVFFLVAIPINMKIFAKRMGSMAEEAIGEMKEGQEGKFLGGAE